MRCGRALFTEKAIHIGTLFLIEHVLINAGSYLTRLATLLGGKTIVEVEK
jgi:hypothetical protein